jgi:hypothetical protein
MDFHPVAMVRTRIIHNTQTTHITRSNETQHTELHTHKINTLHRLKIQQSQVQLYKVILIVMNNVQKVSAFTFDDANANRKRK